MCGGGASAPKAPEPLPQAPTAAPSQTESSGEQYRREAASKRAGTRGGTLVTGSRGLTNEASTQQKTLLGGSQ